MLSLLIAAAGSRCRPVSVIRHIRHTTSHATIDTAACRRHFMLLPWMPRRHGALCHADDITPPVADYAD